MMAGAITGLGTTYSLPNYTGVLYQLSPSSTPLYSAIAGSSNGGGQVTSTEFEWETADLRGPDQNVALEGQDAPNSQERVRGNVTNVAQIHQETVGVSYSKLAAYGQKSGTNNAEVNPITNELDWQIRQSLTQVVRDINWSFWNGRYNKPTDNTTKRQTRGILTALTTNTLTAVGSVAYTAATSATDTITVTHALSVGDKVVFTNRGGSSIVENRVYYVQSVSTTVSFKIAATSGGAALTIGTGTGIAFTKTSTTATTRDVINSLAQSVWDNGGVDNEMTAVFAVNSQQKVAISQAYGSLYQENSRTIGGTNISTVITDFGTFGVMKERAIRQDAIALVSLDELQPVWLETPGKGHLFAEPLAKTGAYEKTMLYGEVGLKYGAESHHGIITGLKLPNA
jgi:co-chaperonin GroES (HSP10)